MMHLTQRRTFALAVTTLALCTLRAPAQTAPEAAPDAPTMPAFPSRSV